MQFPSDKNGSNQKKRVLAHTLAHELSLEEIERISGGERQVVVITARRGCGCPDAQKAFDGEP